MVHKIYKIFDLSKISTGELLHTKEVFLTTLKDRRTRRAKYSRIKHSKPSYGRTVAITRLQEAFRDAKKYPLQVNEDEIIVSLQHIQNELDRRARDSISVNSFVRYVREHPVSMF